MFEFIDGAREIGEAEVDDAIIDQGLAIIRKLWDANLAHRDIKPANLLVRDGKLYLIDVFFTRSTPAPGAKPSTWPTCCSVWPCGPAPAVLPAGPAPFQRGGDQRGVRRRPRAGPAVPAPQADAGPGRDLAAEFVRLLPEAPRPIGVQRWSTRRVTLLLVVALVLLPAAVPLAWLFARSSANPGGAAVVAGGTGGCTQIEELWLQAQAVPLSVPHPCVQALPANVISALAVRDGESVLELGHASLDISLIAGEWPRARAVAGSVTIRLTPTCAAATTGEGPDRRAGRQTLPAPGPVSTPQVVDVFPGGCVNYQPQVDIGPSAPLLDQAQRAVTYRTRDDLREALRRRSGGRPQLDPEGGN